MSKNILRLAGFIGAAGASAALLGVAVAGTGAYFSDSRPGTITGTLGTIKVQGQGAGNNMEPIAFTNMLPGEAQHKTVAFNNTGSAVEDVYAVFDATALHDASNNGLNTTGRFSEVHVKANGTSVFDSANLNDAHPCGTPGEARPLDYPNPAFAGLTDPTVCALPAVLKLVDSLAPGAQGTMDFSYAARYATGNGAQGAQALNLPYTIVATQHGIVPGQVQP